MKQLVAHKGTDDIHVGGAALDDVAGGVGLVPGKGQMLDVPVQVVTDVLDIAFRAFGQIEPLAEAAHAPEHGHCHNADGGHPQGPDGLLPEGVPLQPFQHKGRDFGCLVPQNGVHRQADDLGCQGVEGHTQAGADEACSEELPAAPEIPGDQLGFLLPGQLVIGFHRENTLLSGK